MSKYVSGLLVLSMAAFCCLAYPLRFNVNQKSTMSSGEDAIRQVDSMPEGIMSSDFAKDSKEMGKMKNINILTSQETVQDRIIPIFAPEMIRNYKKGPKYQYGRQERYNVMTDRKQKVNSKENSSQEYRNRIYKD